MKDGEKNGGWHDYSILSFSLLDFVCVGRVCGRTDGNAHGLQTSKIRSACR